MTINEDELRNILEIMEKDAKKLNAPVFRKENILDRDEFKITIFAVLSTRTKDETTIEVCRRFFQRVKNWNDLLKIRRKELEKLIYGVGFYRNKAKLLKELAEKIMLKYNGVIPKNLKELTELPGIGNKVAKVILNEIANLPYIAVDTHVHRISNRLGIIDTKNIKESEEVLERIVPENLKANYNRILVGYGQTICLPRKPRCSLCKLTDICNYYYKKNRGKPRN